MKASTWAVIISDMRDEIREAITTVKTKMNLEYKTLGPDNEASIEESNLHDKCIDYLIYSGMASEYKKLADQSKKELDEAVPNPDGIAGQSVTLGNTNLFNFSKKMNRDGETTLVVDLVTALAQAGVDKEMVDAALKKAKKPKRGNVYYQVTMAED